MRWLCKHFNEMLLRFIGLQVKHKYETLGRPMEHVRRC